MGSIRIKDFKGGLGLRRLPETTSGGTLIHAVDCHITRGGEIAQRADFVSVYEAPPSATRGLSARADKLVIYGASATPPGDLPANFDYIQIVHPTGAIIDTIRSWEMFGGNLVSVVTFFNEDINHLYVEATRVSDVNAPANLTPAQSTLCVHAQNKKINVGGGTAVFFSAIRDAADFGAGAGTGDGVIDMAFETGKSESINALAKYDQYTAIFSRNTIALWSFTADPADSEPLQQFFGLGCVSAHSCISYGDGDVVFIHESGIRSLRARDSSRAPARSDIGTAVDAMAVPLYGDLDDREKALTSAIIEPVTGNLWIAIHDTIFVFSFDPQTKVSAWSTYVPGFVVHYMTVMNGRVYLRDDADTIYVYGAETGPYAYSSDVQAEVWLPYYDADAPATGKTLIGFDAAVRGTWEVRAAYDPENLDASDLIARISGTTFDDERVAPEGSGQFISLRFKCLAPRSATEPAILSSAMIHHDLDDQEDS